MPEAIPVVILIAGLSIFAFIAVPPLLHGSDTGASFFDQLFDVDVGNATDGDGVIFINGTWVNADVNFTGGGGSLGNITIGKTLFGDNTERLYAHLARGTADDITFTFGTEPTEYQIRFHSFDDGSGMGAADNYASWYSVAQLGFNSSADLGFEYYYTTEKVGNGQPFCMQVDVWEFAADGGDLDDTIQGSKAFCDYTPPPPDILERANLVFNSTEHNIDPEDFLIFNLARLGQSNATDTGDYKVYTSDPILTWNLP